MDFKKTGSYFKVVFRELSQPLCWGLILILFGSLLPHRIYAQQDSLKLLQKDTRAITPRYPARAHLDEFISDRDYQYKDDPEPPANPLARWIDYLRRKFFAIFTGKSYESFWQYVLMASALALVVFLLYKAKVLEYIFPSRDQDVNDYIVGQENIHEIDFDKVTGDALTAKDYRLAIRLQYLKTLKALSTKELINWKPNRTNYSYVNELERYPYQREFIQITDYFEFAWYGDFPVDENGYKEMKAFSDAFYNKLNQRSYA